MRELSLIETQNINGGFRIKLHFNVIQAVFTVIGAGILGGPVGAGVALAGVIGAQGTGNLVDMYKEVEPAPAGEPVGSSQ